MTITDLWARGVVSQGSMYLYLNPCGSGLSFE